MLYSEKSGVLFLEVPKTGTVALSTALRGVCRQMREMPRHSTAKRARTVFGHDEWLRLQTFAVVREPMSWLRSWYRFLVGNGRLDSQVSFENFVEAVALDKPIRGERVIVRSQYERVADRRKRRVIVKELLCFEFLADEYNRVNSAYLGGEGAALGNANVSPRIAAEASAGLHSLVAERWSKDFEIWSEVKKRAELEYAATSATPIAQLRSQMGPHSSRRQPVAVFTVGKVGSSSVTKALTSAGFEALQVHVLARRARDMAQRRPQVKHLQSSVRVLDIVDSMQPIKFITLFREPVSRNVSAFFQNFDRLVGGDIESYSVSEIQRLICETVPPDQTQRWLENQLGEFANLELGRHKLFEGPKVATETKWPLLMLRSDFSDEVKSESMNSFLESSQIVVQRNANVTSSKVGGDLSLEVKRLGLPAAYVNECLSQPFVTSTWSPEEVEAQRTRWTAKPE